MEHNPPKLMTPFDCLTTPHWLYMLKLMLPYTPNKIQHSLAVFIRFQEMRYTANHFHGFYDSSHTSNVLNDIRPYMAPSEQEIMEQMESMMNIMELMQSLQETSSDSANGFNPMDMFSSIMGSDFSDIFNMKGDSEHE